MHKLSLLHQARILRVALYKCIYVCFSLENLNQVEKRFGVLKQKEKAVKLLQTPKHCCRKVIRTLNVPFWCLDCLTVFSFCLKTYLRR